MSKKKKKTVKPKKILVTGFTSRQCNPDKNKRDVMVSWLIAEVCRDLGYEVEHRNPKVEESYDEFDHVFWGMAPLHGLGSNRAYGALSCFLKTYPSGRITFYQDDHDNAKVMNGIRTVHNDPARLVKSFFNYKLEYDIANTPEWKKYLAQGVEILNDYAWPTTIIPAFPWAELDRLTVKCPNLVDPVGIDFSAYLPKYDVETPDERLKQWVVEVTDEKWFARQRIDWFPQRYGKGYDKRPDDQIVVQQYAQSWGVINRGQDYGWWNSRIGYAAQTRSIYVTKWQEVESLGDAYTLLPDIAEGLTPQLRDDWAEAQAASFEHFSSPRETVREQIRKLVEK